MTLGDVQTLPQFNPFDMTFRADPYTIYARYRTTDPIHWGAPALPGLPGTWYLFGYADVMAAVRDPRFSSDVSRVVPPEMLGQFSLRAGNPENIPMIFRDPPNHTRLRGLVNKAFTPQAVGRMQPRIEAITTELLDRIAAQPHRSFDLVHDFAYPLPITVITDLLGVPQEDHARFRAWSQAIIAGVDVRQGPEALALFGRTMQEVAVYLMGIFAQRRQNPQLDLISTLLAVEEGGAHLSEAEIITTVALLLSAGHETTVNLISSAVVTLLQNPDQLTLFKTEPHRAENVVEEAMRYAGPAQGSARWVLEDMEFGGRQLRRGDNVYLMYSAANHDPAQWPNPDEFDITRTVGRQLGFGFGIHFCIGAPLARLEGKIALPELFRRLPDLRLATNNLDWANTLVLRGVTHLPVAF